MTHQAVLLIAVYCVAAIHGGERYKPNLQLESLKSKVNDGGATANPNLERLRSRVHHGLTKANLGNLKAQIAHPKFENFKQKLLQQKAVLSSMVSEDVRSADIRLLQKDETKTPFTHPVLPEASIDVNHATSIFETGWKEYFQWSNDLDTEYRSVDKAGELFSSQHYNGSLSSLLILHDRCGSAKDNSVLKIIEALKLRNFDVNYNIFLLDFPGFMCNISPQTGVFKLGFNPQLELLGTTIAKVLLEGTKKGALRPKDTHLIGLGMSTHLAGLIAKSLWEQSGQRINSILGLDPPVRLLKSTVSSQHAEIINVYHTFTRVPGMGPRVGRATADFVFGGAKRRPQCIPSLNADCYIAFGVQLFVSTLLYPKIFPGRWCPDYNKFSLHFCDVNDFIYVSYPPNASAKGTYQMEIKQEFPFGMGKEGIFQKEEKKETADPSGSVDVTTLNDQEYLHHLEMAVSRIRNEMLTCLQGVMTPVAVMRCIMTIQPSVKRLEQGNFIIKISCEPLDKSPTGKKCKYMTRTRNYFELPF